MVSMGTELGGGALAWPRRQQMWPVQGWRGVAGGVGRAWHAGGRLREPPAPGPPAPGPTRGAAGCLSAPHPLGPPLASISRPGLGFLDGAHAG